MQIIRPIFDWKYKGKLDVRLDVRQMSGWMSDRCQADVRFDTIAYSKTAEVMYVSSPAGVGVWVVPGGRGWTPTFAIVAVFAAPAGVGAWVVPGGRGWTPNFTVFGFLYSES